MITSDPNIDGGVWRELILSVCMFLICIAMRKNDMRSLTFIPISSMILNGILSILGITLCLLGRILLVDVDKIVEYFIAVFHLLLFVVEIVGYLLFFKSIKEYNRRIDSEIEKKVTQGGRDLIAVAGANITELRGIRHDMKNQYEIMSRLIDRGEYEKLREYFSEYALRLEESVRGSSSGNTVIDCMMSVECAKAQSRGVIIDDVFAVPSTLPIEDVDMCGILFNIVDNAIDATSAFEDEKMRHVELSVKMHGEFCIIKCSNLLKEERLSRNAAGELVSIKNERGHGYGLNIVRGIVKKYGGEIKISTENGRFVVDIMLQEAVRK